MNRAGDDGRPPYFPAIPEDAVLMLGHDGQFVLIAPDKRLILMRFGITRNAPPIDAVAPLLEALYASAPVPADAAAQ